MIFTIGGQEYTLSQENFEAYNEWVKRREAQILPMLPVINEESE